MKRGMKIWMIIVAIAMMANCKKGKLVNDAIEQGIPTHPLENTRDLDSLIERAGNARIVLLGEASHGTAEYYEWRTAISKRLIEEKGFDFIAIEGEWADSYRVNNFIKGPRQDSVAAVSLLRMYDRWPTWMWGNYEVASLVTWMNQRNQGKPAAEKAGFFGLDVYCLWESMTELMPHLPATETSLISAASNVNNCFQPFSDDPSQYSYAILNASSNCRQQTEQLWQSVLQLTGNTHPTTETALLLQQNAMVALNGERYYRASVSDYGGSWNIRDQHMTETLKRLLAYHGSDSKVIVWEHNTHIGDARYTDMADAGMVNVGQLVREEYGRENVFAVGSGSYEGTVIAASSWGAPMKTMRVPPAQKGSWEHTLHALSRANKIIFSDEIRSNAALQKPIGHRAIGVQYDPGSERGNYVPSTIPERYDAFLYFDKTRALNPIDIKQRNEPPDTYPSGY